MPFVGFEGPAGTGKTYQMVSEIRERIVAPEVRPHQRILAITFMHGSRRRLDERFSGPLETRNRATCMTIDSFASHILRRWQPLVAAPPDMSNFDEVCEACGVLLERPEIARWVSRTFPIVAVDEAQDLRPCRLRIVRALAEHSQMAVAADEFQCLDETADTGPFVEWFKTGDVRRLTQVRRTGRRGLLDAGLALRAGAPPVSGPGLSIQYRFPNQMPFSIGHALTKAWGATAVLVAPGGASWANELIPRLVVGFQTRDGKQMIRPTRIGWESAVPDEAEAVARIACPEGNAASIAITIALSAIPDAPAWLRPAIGSIYRARRAHGRASWSRDELVELFVRKASAHRAYSFVRQRGIPVMTIHGAKNRQFRNVIVLWPPGVPGSAEYQRRLLYNAITRAEERCTVFVRIQALLNAPPFA